jgi:phenylacetic acid degradation operon negative regulatory protein
VRAGEAGVWFAGEVPAVKPTDDAPASRRPQRPKTLILDIYGRYRSQFQGWLAVSDLVELMAVLGVDEQAVRSAVSRMSRRGLLRKEVRGGVRGYATTPEADALFDEADRRIYVSLEPARAEEGWVLASFSMPESERDKRHALRSKLMWLGMGIASSGLWIGPRRLLPVLVDAVKDLGFEEYVDVFAATHEGLGDLSELVSRCWDLEALARSYEAFLADHSPTLTALRRRRSPVRPREAFGTYTLVLHDWRKFPYLDPGLPPDLLPRAWPGRAASELFHELRARLEPLAFDYAASAARR